MNKVDAQPSKVYRLFGVNGIQEITQPEPLPLGQVVSYGDMANRRQEAVIISTAQTAGIYRQPCIFREDFHKGAVSRTDIEGIGGWEIVDEIATVEEIAFLELRAAQALKDRETERQEREARTVRYSLTETAQLIREALKTAFPSQKFSVRSKSYSGGCSIDVSWIDGPPENIVSPVVKSFEGATFDGMQDLKSYVTYEKDGKIIHYGTDYVFTSRRISNDTELLKQIETWLPTVWNMSEPWRVSEYASRELHALDFREPYRNGQRILCSICLHPGFFNDGEVIHALYDQWDQVKSHPELWGDKERCVLKAKVQPKPEAPSVQTETCTPIDSLPRYRSIVTSKKPGHWEISLIAR